MTRIHETAETTLDPEFFDYLTDVPKISYAQHSDSWLRRQLIGSIETLLGRRRVEHVYRHIKRHGFSADAFFKDALDASDINVLWGGEPLPRVDPEVPLVILANHPFGVVDGLVLCDLAMRLRGDFRILINALLFQDRDLAPYFLPIDFADNKQAMRTNVRSKKLARQAMNHGIPVVIFPSGNVSTAKSRFGFGRVKELPWSTFAARIIHESKASVLPVYFHGCNSRKFHVASNIAESLRMALLVHEVRNKFGRDIQVRMGRLLPYSELQQFSSRKALTDHLYESVLSLGRDSAF